MAEYRLEFSTNASQTVKELQSIIASVAKVEKVGGKIVFDLDTSRLSAGIDATFRKLNRQIENSQRVLNKLQIGGPNFQRVAENLGTGQGLRERGRAIAEPIQLRAQSKAFEEGSLVRLGKELKALQIEASQIKPNSQEWASFQQQIGRIQGELKKADQAAEAIQMRENLGAFSPGSLNSLSAKLKLLKIEADAISPSTKRWKEVNAEIQKTEKSIQKVSKKPLSAGQRAGAAGGAFLYGGGMGGGVGSALGGVAGGLAGGVPGAFAGAAIGQVVDNLGQSLAAITSQTSKVQQLQRGLALASIDAKDFAQAQAAVADTSARLFIPIEQVTKSFAQLRVNTKQYGLSVEETKQILEGTILAVSSVGGSADDVDGAMRAVVQILSKGSVQAEELRGQLGERFPGAVVKFAQANKLSFEELQKGLQQGKIGIKEFVTFAKQNYEDYAAFSETLATAPEFAGRRLQIALEQVGIAIGSLFTDAGADIQNTLANTLNAITSFVKNNEAELQTIASGLASLVKLTEQAGAAIVRIIGNDIARAFRDVADAAIVLRNMTGGGNVESVTTERQLTNRRINEKFQDVADLRAKGAVGDLALAEGELKSLQNRRNELDKQFRELGGNAAYQATRPTGLTFGGPGAGMDMTAGVADQDKAAKKKQESLESYHSLQDQLAKNFTQDQLDRMEQEYQARVNRINSEFDLREARANSFQKEAINFERQMSDIELKRQKALLDASAEVIKAQGSVAGGAGANLASGSGFSTAQLQKASSEASKFTGIANMCSESVKAFYKSLGISLPGVTAWADTVRKAGQTMTDWSKLQAGDIVATGRPGDTPHVGVYTGGNNVFHQSRKRGLEAGNYPDLDYFKSGYFVRPNAMGAGAPRKVTGDEKRDVIADQKAQLAVAQQSLAVRNADAQAIRDAAVAWAQYTAAIVPVEEQTLQNDILAKKNELVKASLPEDVIEKELQYFEAQQKTSLAMENNDKLLAKGTIDQKEHANRLLELKTRLAGYNTELDRNIQLQRQQKFDTSLQQLRDQIAVLRIIGEEERRLFELRKEYGSDESAQQIFDLEAIKKNIEEARSLIDGFVSQTSSDYKGFLKAVISGEDAGEALKQFQEGLKDRVLTIVLDFAMAPVEKYFKESLEKLFLPKNIPALKEAEKKPATEITANTNALIDLTTAIRGMAPLTAPGLSSSFAPTSALSGSFDASNVFGPIAQSTADTLGATATAAQTGLADINLAYGSSVNFLGEAAQQAGVQSNNFGQSLGSAVGAIGGAAGAIMGIAAGIGQMSQGGTSGVLGGLGSIFMTLGGAIGGIGGMFGGGGGLSSGFNAGSTSAINTGSTGWSTAFSTPLRFANGAVVNGPTLGMVGEGKYSEAIVPLPDGRSIPVQMRGNQQSSRDLLANQRQQQASMPNISMSFQTSTINGVEYVSRDQLEQAMAATRKQAAKDGANRGMTMTLDKLQQSPSTRSRLGMGGR